MRIAKMELTLVDHYGYRSGYHFLQLGVKVIFVLLE